MNVDFLTPWPPESKSGKRVVSLVGCYLIMTVLYVLYLVNIAGCGDHTLVRTLPSGLSSQPG